MLKYFGLTCACFMMSVESKKTLMILENLGDKDSVYSEFILQLQGRQHQVDVMDAKNKTVELESYGVYQYDNVILFAPTAKEIGSFKNEDLHAFIQAGGNFLMASR